MLSLNGTYTNDLALNLSTNAVLNLSGDWVNTGTINATSAVVNLSGDWANTGAINASEATVNLGGNFTVAGVGMLNRSGGTVNLTGIVDGSGGTLVLNASRGSWVMSGGTVRSAILSTSGGVQLLVGNGTLDGVTVNGELDVGNAINSAILYVLNGLVL